MQVSVIIPCYNYGNFLAEAVNSVCAQSYADWECLIVDDGSTDNTKEVALALAGKEPRVNYLHKENGGLSSARNYGIAAARGEFICFLDADDLFDKDKLKEQVAAFAATDAGIVYGNAMFFDSSDPKRLYPAKFNAGASELSEFSGQGQALLSLLVKKNITVVSAPLIRKDVFTKVGGFDTAYRSYEDWHFWLRCALAGYGFAHVPIPAVCTYIRYGHESMMSDRKKLLRAGIQLRGYMGQHLPATLKPYNFYRQLRSRIKLVLSK